jgi:hypothetical protein
MRSAAAAPCTTSLMARHGASAADPTPDDLQGRLGASSAIVGGLSAKARVTRAASSTFLDVAQRDRPMMSLTACSCWSREPTAAMVMRGGRWIKTVDQPSIGWRGQQGR